MSMREIETGHGTARAHVHVPDGAPRLAVILGHGAGGSVDAPDLLAVTEEATALGAVVVRVEQPYRVAGKKAGPRPPALDEAWLEVLAALRADELAGLPLVQGGRSAGARVACRTAGAAAADGVLCLAFPTRPPGRPDAPSRQDELDGAGVPTLVVQGATDPYGVPDGGPQTEVVVVPGDHSLRRGVADLRPVVRTWLADRVR
ncbi:alpha/beta hydrolase [Cellulomonas sp. APG4]|nr:alpha/beta family hydrolase [Cellulomonas sp. APG4]NCT90524.1 alpha/beta hydrolase [Cellulomonas sp. APG4]